MNERVGFPKKAWIMAYVFWLLFPAVLPADETEIWEEWLPPGTVFKVTESFRIQGGGSETFDRAYFFKGRQYDVPFMGPAIDHWVTYGWAPPICDFGLKHSPTGWIVHAGGEYWLKRIEWVTQRSISIEFHDGANLRCYYGRLRWNASVRDIEMTLEPYFSIIRDK